MYNVTLSYSQFLAKSGTEIKYADTNGNYYLYYTAGDTEYCCILDRTSSESVDFETNYKSGAVSIL